MIKGGYGCYADLKETRKPVDKDNYHDVYAENLTDWDDAYGYENDIDIDCIKKSLDYRQAQTDGTAAPAPQTASAPETASEAFWNMDSSNEFWYYDPSVLWDNMQLFPNKKSSFAENLNSLVRIGIIGSAAMAYWNGDSKYLLIGIAILILSVFFFMNDIHSLKELIDYFQGEKKTTESYCNGPKCNQEISERNVYWRNRDPNMIWKKMEDKEGLHRYRINDDMLCAARSENDTTGGYDWIKQSSHAEFRGNSRLVDQNTSPEVMQKISGDLADNYGKEIAGRNSYIAVHPRDFINTNPEEFFFGKNLDRRLYYGRR